MIQFEISFLKNHILIEITNKKCIIVIAMLKEGTLKMRKYYIIILVTIIVCVSTVTGVFLYVQLSNVITSYSIHYTKLYDVGFKTFFSFEIIKVERMLEYL